MRNKILTRQDNFSVRDNPVTVFDWKSPLELGRKLLELSHTLFGRLRI
jgi:hypothetical protein